MGESSASNIEELSQYMGTRKRSERRKQPRVSLDFGDFETDSPASISEEEPSYVRGRGRGKARGTGRGRGGRRGGRVFKGQRFEEGEEERLRHLQEERRDKADRQQQEPPVEPGPSVPVPSWCVCTHCPNMDRYEDKFCCGMASQYCNSLRPEMGLVITDPLTLHIQQTFGNDVFAHQADTIEDTNRSLRHAAYRQYVLWVFGRLQKDDRKTVPACCVKLIRDKFPSPSGQYTGFIPARYGIGW